MRPWNKSISCIAGPKTKIRLRFFENNKKNISKFQRFPDMQPSHLYVHIKFIFIK